MISQVASSAPQWRQLGIWRSFGSFSSPQAMWAPRWSGRIVEHPDLELVGLYCYSPDKIGRDAGEIVGLDPIGVIATGEVADVLEAKPDVVNFNGVWPDIDLFCTLLEAGINVVTTSDWITGYHRNRNHPHPSGKKPTELIEAACQQRRHDLLRHRHEPGPGPDPERGGDGRHGAGGPHHGARDGRRLLPSLGRHLEERRLRPAGGRPRGARTARDRLHRLL